MVFSGLNLILVLFVFFSGCVLSRVYLGRLRRRRLVLGREEEFFIPAGSRVLYTIAVGRTGRRSDLRFPLFDISYRVELAWFHRTGRHIWRRWEKILPLSENAEGGIEVEQTGLLRGDYRGRDGFFISDWFGFFRFSLISSRPLQVKVTILGEEQTPLFNPSPRAEGVSSFVSLPSEEEMVENRPYYPGDDPRRINWKQYARFDDLFIRTSHNPIPRNKLVLCILSAEEGGLEETDLRAAFYLGICRRLEEKGCQVFTLLPGQEEMIRSGYSGIPSVAPGVALPAPFSSPGHVVFIGRRGSPEEVRWKHQAGDQGIPFSLFDPMDFGEGGRS